MRRYYKDYMPDQKVLDNGKVIKNVSYHGDYYEYKAGRRQFTVQLKRLSAGMTVYSLLFVGIGLLNSPGSRNFAVVLPYFFSFLPMAYGYMALFGRAALLKQTKQAEKGFNSGDTIKKMEFARYDKIYCRIKKCSAAMAILMAASSFASLIFIIMHIGDEGLLKEILFFAGAAVMTITANYIRIENKRYPCLKIEKESTDIKSTDTNGESADINRESIDTKNE